MSKKTFARSFIFFLAFSVLFGSEYMTGDMKNFTGHIQESIALTKCAPNTTQEKQNKFKVDYVIDGDTVDIFENCVPVTIRLMGINTPETVDPRKPVQCYGKEASSEAKRLLTGKTITLKYEPMIQSNYDKYGRTLGYIFLPDGTNFNEYMIAQGFAYEYTYFNQQYSMQKEFRQAQANAKTSGKGLWATSTCNGKL